MSTKTSIKRIALVAVSALGFGLLSVMPAKAADSTATSVISPVRVSFTGANQDQVTKAQVTLTADANWAAGDVDTTNDDATINVTLSEAPTAAATLAISAMGDTGTVVLGTGDTLARASGDMTYTSLLTALTVGANTAGTYKGTITIDGNANAASDQLVASFSFTTVGAPKSIGLSSTALSFPALAAETKTNTITLKDANGNLTQSSTVDTLAVTITDATNLTLTSGASLTDSDLYDGTVTYTITGSATADSETVTVTPQGTLPGLGVAAVTFTVTTLALGDTTLPVTSVTAPTSSSVIKAGATAIAKTVDKAVTTYSFSVSGWQSGKAYKIITLVADAGSGDLSATVNGNAQAAGSLAADTLKGVSDGSAITVSVVLGGTISASDTISVDGNGDGDYTDSSDMVVTLASAAYAVSVTTPVVTPSIQKTGASIVVAGSVADQFGTALNAATVTVTGAQTLSSGTAAALTAQTVTASDGSWSVTLPAANALTTSVSITAAAVKTGTSSITDTTGSPVVVKLNAAGSADTITASLLGDEDTATTATTLPLVVVPYTGLVKGTSDELYTIANADGDGTYNFSDLDSSGTSNNGEFDNTIAVTATTDPDGQIVATGSTGVLFYTAAPVIAGSTVASGKATVTVADSGSANLWVTSTKTGLNTFTITSGNVSKTYKFYAYNYLTAGTSGDAARNIAVTATKSLKPSEIGTITGTITDAFGNPVLVAATATVSATITSGTMFDGPSLTKSYTATDAAGNFTIGLIAGGATGTSTVTVTGANAQFGAAVGATTGTTAGTNGLTASTKTATSTITIAGETAKSAEVLASEAAEAEAKKATTAAGEAKTEAAAATKAAGEAKTEAASATKAATEATAAAKTAGTDAVAAAKAAGTDAVAAAKAAGTDAVAAADAAKAAAAKAGTDAVAAADAAKAAAVAAADAAKAAAVAAADAAKAEAAKATAAAAANAVEIAKILAAVTALKSDTSAADAYDAALEAIDAANGATDAAQLAMDAADAATVAAEEARDAADAATAAVEELATQVSTLIAGLKAQLTTLANTVAKIAKKVKA